MNQSKLCYCCCTIALVILAVGLETRSASRGFSAGEGLTAAEAEDYFASKSNYNAESPLDTDVFVVPHHRPTGGAKTVRANTITFAPADSSDRRHPSESNTNSNFDDSEFAVNSFDDNSANDNPITRGKVISLLRQSNFLVPIENADYETILLRSRPDPSDRLPARGISSNSDDNIGGDQIASILRDGGTSDASKSSSAAVSYIHNDQVTRRFRPGDTVYGSYDLGPIGRKQAAKFLSHHQMEPVLGSHYGVVLDKTNDAYFLLMVGAFCVMAMAVVLAAGMFAYRIQQNRKTSSDTDYPTYGVVGPSIMNGKCGAAAFVGGYLGGAHRTGGSTGASAAGSKSGSKSHLADSLSGDSALTGSEKSAGGKRTGSGGSQTNLDQQTQQVQAIGQQLAQQKSSNSNVYLNQNAARMFHYQQHQKQQMVGPDRAAGARHNSASDLDSEDENDDGSYTVYECPGLASAHEMEIKNPLFNDDRTP